MESNESKNSALKVLVQEKYGEIARQSLNQLQQTTCCGMESCGEPHDFTAFNDDYSKLAGYTKEADLKLGCGIPTEIAAIKSGDTVLDLGSGAGNDAFVARALVGESGRVIGVDMTEAMIEKATKNAAALGYTNVEFIHGDIEAMPLEANSVNVVISNCVLNLVPDKKRAFQEVYRVLAPGGHFSISDIVLTRDIPPGLQKAAEMYAGCVSGAVKKDTYLAIINQAGFKDVEIKLEKPINLPTEVLAKYLTTEEVTRFQSEGAAVLSITVYGTK